MLCAGDTSAFDYARRIGIGLPSQCLVVVIRTPGDEPCTDRIAGVLNHVWHRHRALATWREPDELVTLLAVPDRCVSVLVNDVARMLGGPCAVGGAAGPVSQLAETCLLARRICRVAPAQRAPNQVHTLADVFVELGVAQLPEIDEWLRNLARRLANGPDLVRTVDAFYRNDMSRSRAAVALGIHPRTLDYRLRRVQELSGIDPHSTQGVRILTAAVSRLHAVR